MGLPVLGFCSGYFLGGQKCLFLWVAEICCKEVFAWDVSSPEHPQAASGSRMSPWRSRTPSSIFSALSCTTGFRMLECVEKCWIQHRAEPAGCRDRLDQVYPNIWETSPTVLHSSPFPAVTAPCGRGKGVRNDLGFFRWTHQDAGLCPHSPAVAGSRRTEQAPRSADRK